MTMIPQISEMKPATSYVFLVRAENTYGLSVPSPLSSMIRTQGSDHGYVPHSELVAARSVLAGKVSVVMVWQRDLWLLIAVVN